jgi:hypothetical protein
MFPALQRRHLVTVLLFASALVAGCASTRLTDSWSDPSFTGGPFKKWLVVAVGGNTVATRVLEDTMVAKLKARGADAVQGYQFLPSGRASEQQLDGAVTASGAQALMLVHLRRVETRTQVTTAVVPVGGPGFGWGGVYGGWMSVPDVQQYQVATVETTVYQVAQRRLVWSGVTQTFDPSSISTEAPAFADLILGELAQHGLAPAGAG